MSTLFFSGTQEHALLALVIKDAEAAESVAYFGRTALQKVVYFLKALGVPTRYQFEVHHYGPFCDQINADIDLLIADGLVMDRAPSSKYSNYRVNEGAGLSELLSGHEKFIGSYSDLVKKVVAVFGRLEPRDLELYATLHYAYRYETAGAETPSKDAVIARFKEYKGTKFPPEQLNAAFDAMVAARLIKAQTST